MWRSVSQDLCACALRPAQGPGFKETGSTTVVGERGLWAPGPRPSMCAKAGKAGEKRCGGSGQWGGRQPGTPGSARPGSQSFRLLPRPPAEPRGTPSVTWRPPGSPWGLARGSPGPPRAHAKEGASGGPLWPRRVCTPEPFSSCRVPLPSPGLCPRAEGLASPPPRASPGSAPGR